MSTRDVDPGAILRAGFGTPAAARLSPAATAEVVRLLCEALSDARRDLPVFEKGCQVS